MAEARRDPRDRSPHEHAQQPARMTGAHNAAGAHDLAADTHYQPAQKRGGVLSDVPSPKRM